MRSTCVSLNSPHSALNSSVAKGRFELPRLVRHGVLSTACLPVPPLGRVWLRVDCLWLMDVSSIRALLRPSTLNHEPSTFEASSMGFEPTTSTVTGWRALRTALRGLVELRVECPELRVQSTRPSLNSQHFTLDSQCVGQESNLHCVKRVGYSHLGTPMPSRRVLVLDSERS